MRHRPIIAILLALTAVVPALAQAPPPGQVRVYLSTYTDDAARSATQTWTWNMTEVRKRWVCPYCGYSTYWEGAGSPGNCPNPFGIASHPANTPLVQADAKSRVLGLLAALSADDNGDPDYPLVGRPFHPGGLIEPIWNDDPSPWEAPSPENVASYLTVRANVPAGAGELVENGDGVRFVVVKPGAVRAAARPLYFDSSDTIVAAPTFFMTAGGGGATADQYAIHINPYRVSDGDVWYIRHHEERAGGVTTVVAIQAYSTLYGNDFDSAGQITGAGLTNYDANGGCQIITDSGALRVEIPRQLAADGSGTWVLKIAIASNTRTMPSPDEVNYDSVYGVDMYTDPGEDEPDFLANGIAEDLSPIKAPYVVVDDTRSPLIASADAGDGVDYLVEEKLQNGDGFVHTATAHADETWPYRMPPEAAGVGRLIMQWSELAPSPALQSFSTGANDIFYRTGAEWHYLADLATPDNRIMTNADVAANVALTGNLNEDYAYLDARFMCSRLDVNLTGDEWVHGTVPPVPTETDDEPATGGYPGIIIGDLIATGPPDRYGGEYGPGTHTPTREFTIANRTPAPVSVCPVENGGCGARYLRSAYAPGDACPACGVTLVAGHGEADVHYDAHTPPAATVAGDRYWMTPEALRFGPGAGPVPMGALDFVQQVFADIPAYQPPSVPPGASRYENDIDSDLGYYGTMVAFDRPGGSDPTDANFAWDVYFRSPNTGNRFGSPTETAAAAEAENVCPVCQARYSSAVAPANCLYCGAALNSETPPVPDSALVAEEFDPFGLQVSVLRRAALAANQRIVDLGWVAPGVPVTAPNVTNGSSQMVAGSRPEPADVSERSDVPVRNEGNIQSVAQMRSGYLFRTAIDPAVRSMVRWAQTVPLTVGTLFRYRPGGPLPTDDIEFGSTAWALARQQATGAAGEEATALVQAGHRDDGGAAYAGVTKPVPLGQPVGNYASEVILFIDLDGNGALNFYDALVGVTDSNVTEFDPDVDEPFEPVASFATRMRVVEGRLPQNDFYSRDVDPTVLVDTGRSNVQVLWAGQRAVGGGPGAPAPAGTTSADAAAPSDPMNLIYANGSLLPPDPLDPLYRGYAWDPIAGDPDEADALTVSATPAESNSSPTAYIDPNTGDRWAMWHRSLTTAAGMSSQLRFDMSGGVDWDGSSATEYLFGTTGAQAGLVGFARDGAANEQWVFWHAGPAGREMIRFRPAWDPTSGTVPQDLMLAISNAARAGGVGYFVVGPERYRKPAQSPFTYARQPSAFGTYVGDPNDPEFQVDVLFTGHIRALGNSDICWTRFNFGRPSDPDFPLVGMDTNYGKVPFPRVVNAGAIRMPAIYDAAGTLRGYAGEQLEPSPRRQSYQSRDIDWLVSERLSDPSDPPNPFNFAVKPDWTGWETAAGAPGLETYVDPKFYIGVVTDTAGTRIETLYAVSWLDGTYDRATGTYRVTPVLTGIHAGGTFALPLNPGHPDNDHLGELIAPAARADAEAAGAFAAPGDYEEWPSVTLQISPASGTLKWSSPLFNPDNPGDPLSVFNLSNTADVVEVVMYADYTPFVRRVTTDPADDDSPSAFYDLGDSSRLTVFWRRAYGDTDTPHFGRPAFMYRTYTTALQVGRPPIAAGDITEVFDLTDGVALVAGTDYLLTSPANGIIQIDPVLAAEVGLIGHRIRVTYVDASGNTQVEQHRVVGWSTETPVPVNAVVSEGPLRVFPEIYTIAGTNSQAVRYWLAWASGRPVYDLRPASSNGQRVHQSSDVYLAVVAPEYSSLIADLQVPRLGP